MADACAAGPDQGDFRGGEVAGVGEDGAGREEAVGIVDGGVGWVVREERCYEGDFGGVFRDVGLDGEGGIGGGEGAEVGEQSGSAGGGEAGGDDGGDEGSGWVDFGAVGDGGAGGG